MKQGHELRVACQHFVVLRETNDKLTSSSFFPFLPLSGRLSFTAGTWSEAAGHDRIYNTRRHDVTVYLTLCIFSFTSKPLVMQFFSSNLRESPWLRNFFKTLKRTDSEGLCVVEVHELGPQSFGCAVLWHCGKLIMTIIRQNNRLQNQSQAWRWCVTLDKRTQTLSSPADATLIRGKSPPQLHRTNC